MDAWEHEHEPVRCPLCGALVRDRPDPGALDIRMLERHLANDCPARVGPDPGTAMGRQDGPGAADHSRGSVPARRL